MKKIKLKISDRVFSELQSTLTVKSITGSLYGVLDLFIAKLVTSIDKGELELTLTFKEGDKERDEKKNNWKDFKS